MKTWIGRVAVAVCLTSVALLMSACTDAAGPVAPTAHPGAAASLAEAEPGTDVNSVGPSKVLLGSLAGVAQEVGRISISVDAEGTNSPPTTIQVAKPAGATVRKVFVASASTGFSGHVIPNGAVQIAGVGINWNISTPSSISSHNHWADATTALKPVIDALPAGLNLLPYNEASTFLIDGTILLVVFDDPAVTVNQTLAVMFGAQAITGDNFFVNLANPIANAADPALKIDMGLGISFGFQPSSQFSIVDVNGVRLTSCAGGQDDGGPFNGGLITIGGLGDLNDNPVPNCSSFISPRTDDELYSLVPFVHTGDTQIHVFSQNPSNDDNIFLAYFMMNLAGNVTTQPDGTPPSCQLTKTGVNSSGQKYIEVTVQDTKSGLQTVLVTKSNNSNSVVPPFTPFTTDPVVVTSTKINQTMGSQLELRVTDGAGNVTNCDPVDVTLKIGQKAARATAQLEEIPAAEHYIQINNEQPGVRSLIARVNGRTFVANGLKSGESRTLDVAAAMRAGSDNVVTLTALGATGSSVWVIIRD